MDPDWLLDHASVTGLINTSSTLLHFRNPQASKRLIRIPLFQKDELCTDDIAVKIKLYFQDPPTRDSDPIIMLCDKTTCNGNLIADINNVGVACYFVSLTPGNTFTGTLGGTCGGLTQKSSISPKKVIVTLRPKQQWGSFHLTKGGGFTAAATFTTKLDVKQGLFVELYGPDVEEEYKLEYMEVEVTRND